MNPTTAAAAAADPTIAPTIPAPNRFLVPFEYLLEDSSLKEHAPYASHLSRGQRRNVQFMRRLGYTYKQISMSWVLLYAKFNITTSCNTLLRKNLPDARLYYDLVLK